MTKRKDENTGVAEQAAPSPASDIESTDAQHELPDVVDYTKPNPHTGEIPAHWNECPEEWLQGFLSGGIYPESKEKESYEQAIEKINAITTPDNRISDYFNVPLNIKKYFYHFVEVNQKRTNTKAIVPRIVFVGDDGTTYTTTGSTAFNSLNQILKLLASSGFNEWPEQGMRLEFFEISRDGKRIFNIKLHK